MEYPYTRSYIIDFSCRPDCDLFLGGVLGKKGGLSRKALVTLPCCRIKKRSCHPYIVKFEDPGCIPSENKILTFDKYYF
jgi:hypothetical protein